jgi:hypothetical protein
MGHNAAAQPRWAIWCSAARNRRVAMDMTPIEARDALNANCDIRALAMNLVRVTNP